MFHFFVYEEYIPQGQVDGEGGAVGGGGGYFAAGILSGRGG